MLKTIAVVLAFVVVSLASAAAQQEPKNEVGLLLGATVAPRLSTPNENADVRFGSGLTFQATYARRLTAAKSTSLYFEVPFLSSPLVNVSSSVVAVPANYAFIFITPGVRLKFRASSAVAPWFSVGAGYATFQESAERQDGSPNPGVTTNKAAVQFGGGVDFRTPIKILFPIALRAEVRDFYAGKPNYVVNTDGGFQHTLVFSGGFVVSF